MKYSLIAGLVLAMGLSACGKKEEAAAPEPTPAPATQAPAPMAAPTTEAPAPMAAPAPQAAAPAAAAFDAAATYKTDCASCHGPNGEGVATFPKLAGKTAELVKARLTDYKAGKTVGPQTALMAPHASKLSDSEIDAMATYIATLK